MPLVRTVVAMLAIAGALVLAPSAGAAVTLGGDLAGAEPAPGPCPVQGGVAGCGVIQVTRATLSQAAPSAGVITSWRAFGGGEAFVFVASVPIPNTTQMTRIRSSAPALLIDTAPSGPIATRLPIAAGQYVGLRVAVGGTIRGILAEPTATGLGYVPLPADGATGVGGDFNPMNDIPDPPSPGLVAYTATVEPDIDGDGFGDETQDKCPTKATPALPGGPCVIAGPAFTGRPTVKTVTQGKASRVVFNVSEAASVRAKIEQKTTGRKVGKTCKKATRKNAKRKKCTRYVPAGSKTLSATAGLNAFSLGKLKAARYRLTLTPTGKTGGIGKAVAVSFKVKPKPKKRRR